MSRRSNLLLALALSLSVAPACDEAIEGDFSDADDIEFRPGFGAGGLHLNTNALGDHPLHEFKRYYGQQHGDVVLEGVYIKRYVGKILKTFKLSEVWVEKGEIMGRISPDLPDVLRGPEMQGSEWRFFTYGGGLKERSMTLAKYRFDKKDNLHKYTFGYPKDPAYGTHFYTKKGNEIPYTDLMAACASEGGNLEAVVYENLVVDMKTGAGKEKQDIINLACLSGAIGKAALWGYKSYEMGVEKFIGGVRTIRADYCGDGDSWTKPGTAVDLADIWSINKFVDPNFKTESLWSSKGAVCVSNPRRVNEFKPDDVLCNGKQLPLCEGADFNSFPEAILWTKTPQ